MATKTWKIGERCKGGIITVEIKGKVITVIGKEWDNSAGYTRSSNQSNAKEWCRETFHANNSQVKWNLDCYLSDLSTSYHASQIIDWVKSKVELNNEFQY